MALNKLFGDKLLTKSGLQSTETIMSGKKAVGIYFSAHWCPPCRGFTPKLSEMYKNSFQDLGMEIVFVSSDRDVEGFNSYYGEMPWTALPYTDRETKALLSKKYKVQGIPCLVIVDADGKTITTEGTSAVQKDPKGEKIPWQPKPFADIIGDKFLKGNATVGKEAINGKTLAIYFSAHWCPPCRSFTPVLAKHYKQYKEAGKPFELIFSTADRSEEDFQSYRKEMQDNGGDWLSIPFDDEATRDQLDTLFKVSGIPKLVIVGEDGRIINDNAVRAVKSDTTGAEFPWHPPAVCDLAQPEGIEDTPSICVFMEEADADARQAIQAQVEEIANRYVNEAKANDDDPKYRFYVAKASEGAAPQLRRMSSIAPVGTKGDMPKLVQKRTFETMDNSQAKDIASAGADVPMVLLDLRDNGGFYTFKGKDITVETITGFIQGYEAKTLTRQQLQK